MTEPTRSERAGDLIARRRSTAKGGLQRRDVDEPAPLSTIQLGLWTLEAMGAVTGSTNRPTAARLLGPLDHRALRVALEQLVERHEPLRTIYPWRGDEPVQQLVPLLDVDLEVRDLSHLDEPTRRAEVAAALDDAKHSRLDPAVEIQFAPTLLVESPESHVLVVALNHIAFDGWSESVFRSDLLELYRAAVDGIEPALPDLPIRFSDYARWEREVAADRDIEADLAYWRDVLGGVGESPQLPVQADAGSSKTPVTVRLDPLELSAIRSLARTEKTTPFVVLLAGVELAARELLDAEDFVTLCPVAGRDRPEVHDLIGCFINHLYVRSSLLGADTHLAHLRAVRARVADALAHRSVPNRRVLEQFGGWSRRPTINRISVQWRDFPHERTRTAAAPLSIEPLRIADGATGLDLYVTPDGDAADMEIQFNSTAFGPASVSAWADRLRSHLRNLCTDPNRPLAPLRPHRTAPDPTAHLVVEKSEPVVYAIARQANRAPESVAVTTPLDEITYGELWERSGQLVAALQQGGVEPGSPVGVLTNRNAGQAVAMVGVLRAGGVVVPLDAQLPKKRLGLMADLAGVRHTVVVDECAPPAGTADQHVIALDRLGVLTSGARQESFRRVSLDPQDDKASVFFTSGTSGDPKAVAGTHQGLSHFIAWERSRLGTRPGDVVAGITGPSFDVSLRELFLPLTSGATLSCAPEHIHPDRALSWLDEAGVTILHITPSLASAWLAERTGEVTTPSLRWTLFAGESLVDVIVEQWREASNPSSRIMNLYGPTETCMAKAGFEVGATPRRGVQPVGHALPATQFLIVEPGTNRLCDPGEVGEILIRTRIGTLGYLGERQGGFVPNPFGDDPDDVVYRTGDLGWYEPDWSVTVHGRIDDQVKIEGIRVEPGETAAFLRRHPGVRECVVLPVTVDERTTLVAFVVAEGEPPSDRELRRHLHEWLRASAIPPTFEFVDAIPLTPNNKTDRRALLARRVAPAPAQESHQGSAGNCVAQAAPTGTTHTISGTDPLPSRPELAELVAAVWAEVLGVDELTPGTDFFAAGGTSMRALRIMARLEARTGVAGSIELFFDSPTLDEFTEAFRLEVDADDADAPSEPTSDSPAAENSVPLSFMQEAMFYEAWADPDTTSYLVDRVFELRGPLDVDALAGAVGAVDERHSGLRSRMVSVGGEPRTITMAPGTLRLEVQDCGGADDAAIADRLADLRSEGFDLAAGPLVRFVLLRRGPEHHLFVVLLHHIVSDGWSMRLLTAELSELYSAAVEGREPNVPDLEVQYADYVERQRRRDAEGAFDAGLAHFHARLASPLPELRIGTGDRPVGRSATARHLFPLDQELATTFSRRATELRATPFMLGLALWSAFLCRKAEVPEIVVGVPVAERTWAPTTPLIGAFLNNLVLRLPAGETTTLAELAEHTRAETLAAFRHAEVPFERVLETVAPDRRRSRTPLFQVLFQYNHDEAELRSVLELHGVDARRVDAHSSGPPIDLYLALTHAPDRTVGRLHYDPRILADTEAAQLAEEFLDFARSAVAAPHAPFPDVAARGEAVSEAVEVPLSYAQERMWTVEQMEPGTSQYVMRMVYRVTGPIDAGALESALSDVVARHDVLRMRIVSDVGTPRGYIDPPWRVELERFDLTSTGEATVEVEPERLLDDRFLAPFALEDGRLVRAGLISLGADEAIFVVAFHHIVIDGQSYALLVEDLHECYEAHRTGRPARLEPMAHQYADFAAHQRQRAEEGSYTRSLEFWDRVLASPLPPARIGGGQGGGAATDGLAATASLTQEASQAFAELAVRLRVTPYMLAMALWSAVCCEEAESDEVLLTAVLSDRSWEPAEDLVGYFVNTVPLRIGVSADDTVDAVARHVRSMVLQANQFGDVPLDLILDRAPEAIAGGSIIGGMDIEVKVAPERPLALGPDNHVEPYAGLGRRRSDTPKFDLAAVIDVSGKTTGVRLRARASAFSQADVDRLTRRLAGLVEAVVAHPGRALRSGLLRADTNAGAETVAASVAPRSAPWASAAGVPVPAFRAIARRVIRPTVVENVVTLARAEPRRPMIEACGEVWSREDFMSVVGGVAARLTAHGVSKGDRVLLAADRSPYAIAAMYAAWTVGAAYVPVDTGQPDARLEAIVADAEPVVVLADDPATCFGGLPTIVVSEVIRDAPLDLVAPDPESAAYVIYTSGSMGRPKGVVVSHRALAAFVEGAATAYALDDDDRILQFHSLAFDASVEEIHAGLGIGATLVLRTDELLGSARRFLDFVEREDLTVVAVPTAFWHELTRQVIDADLTMPRRLRTLIIGGEAARVDILAAWHEQVAGPVLVNSYGPTEATVSAFAGVARPGHETPYASIGRPFVTVGAAIVDRDGREVAPGEWGELLLSGDQLATGYLGLPDKTDEVFVTRADGERWYRTGDRARQRLDGEVEVSGRFDAQLKIHGHRIEPGEIEAALRSVEGIDEAVVLGIEAAPGELALHAFVATTDVDDQALRSEMGRRLPAPMQPAHYHLSDVLPLGVGGKVDRGRLRELGSAGSEPAAGGQDDAIAAPLDPAVPTHPPGGPGASATVDALVEVWVQLFEGEDVDAGSDFFDLGGRSLTAVRLVYLIEEKFGVSLPVATVLELPTVAGLAAAIDAVRAGEPVPGAEAVELASDPPSAQPEAVDPAAPARAAESFEVSGQPGQSSEAAADVVPAGATKPATLASSTQPLRLHLDRAPLSLAQQRMWLHQRLHPETMRYLVPLAYRLRGPLDRQALIAALEGLAVRHETLRTRVVQGPEGRPQQIIDPVASIGAGHGGLVDVIRLDSMEPAGRLPHAQQLAARFRAEPIDVSEAHPYKAQLIELSPTDHLLTIVFHHLAIDDHSVGVVGDDLATLYAAGLGHDGRCDDLPAQFADFAVWQRAQLAEGVHDRSVEYWRSTLGPSPRAAEVPGLREDGRPGGAIHEHEVDLPPSVGRALLELAERHGVSPFQLLVALASIGLGRFTASDRVLIGTPGSERRTHAHDPVVGLFINTIVLRTDLPEDATFVDVLGQVRRRVVESLDHGGLPFDALLDALDVPRESTGVPLVSVMCAFYEGRSGRTGLTLPGLDVERVRTSGDPTGPVAELMISGSRRSDGALSISLRHDDGLVDPWAIAQLTRVMERLATACVDHPTAAIADLPLVDDGDEAWLAEGYNGNDAGFPTGTRVDTTFGEVAARHAGSIAVTDRQRSITYAQLDLEADRLADQLLNLGLEPGATVAVELDRSVELVVALVAILKAGGVYVPLDADAPSERRDLVLDLAGVGSVISRGDGGALHIDTYDRQAAGLGGSDQEVPAYVMFTSGSTGTPKGAIITHRAIQRLVHEVDYADLGPGVVIGMASNPAFDALTFEVWGALLNGGSIVVLDRDTLADPVAFAAAVREGAITTMFLTTSLVTLIAAAVPDAFATLTTLLVGGEAAEVSTMRALLERGPKRLVNAYGPTECTTFSAWHHVTELPPDTTTVPIGGPTRNTELHVLDDRGRLAPNGMVGELYIGGPGLAVGYLGDPELTASRFVELPIAGRLRRLYRTGDVVRRGPRGAIHYLGRRDHQVKLRGFRIELSEVEAALLRCRAVSAGAVVVRGEGAHRRLVAFATPVPGRVIDEARLRAELMARLPSYMVPSRIVVVDQLPLSQSGKLDRRALIEPPADEGPTPSRAVVMDSFERAVVSLWQDTLQAGTVDLDDDFFEGGGNSLLAVELLAKIDERYGVHLRLSSLFDTRTPRLLAASIREQAATAAPATTSKYLVTVRRGSGGARTPLWLVHPAGGSLVLYEPMAAHLVADCPVLGVEAVGLDGAEPPHTDIGTVADHQVTTILDTQPQGPYRIVGYSVGGIIALEVARRLRLAGHEVELLGAIEAGVPDGPAPPVDRRAKYAALLRERAFGVIGNELVTSIKQRTEDIGEWMAHRNTIEGVHERVKKGMVAAFNGFHPQPLDIPITVFFGDEGDEGAIMALVERWGEIATGGVSVRRVTGAHEGDTVLREPHAKVLAEALDDELSTCDRQRMP